jgi:hypothetical protein
MKRHGNTSATNNKLPWTIVLSDRATNSPTVSGGFLEALVIPNFDLTGSNRVFYTVLVEAAVSVANNPGLRRMIAG